jgi:hypothetical protein
VQPQAGGLLSMAISGRIADVLIVSSRESGAATAPQLVISYTSPPTPTATPTATATRLPPTATPTATPIPPTAAPAPQRATLNPVQDTYIQSSAPTSTVGGSSQVLVADGYGAETSFLRFDLSALAGKTITSATLRLHTSTESWASSAGTFDVNLVTWNAWQEQWMSYTNTVPVTNTSLGTLSAPVASNTWYDTTLSPLAVQPQAGGLLSMAISGRIADVLIVSSRESGASTAPQLVLTYR